MNRTSCRNYWPLGFFVLVCGSLLFSFIGNVHPQNLPQGPHSVGKTEPKLIIPFVVTDAGPFKFHTDTDHDGMSDACETASGLDPNNPADADGDLDGDGLTNGDECALGTLPTNADTDGDGVADGEEVRQGFDPLDPSSTPPQGVQLTSIRVAPLTLGLTINAFLGPIPAQLTVTGILSNGQTVDLTRNPATSFESLDIDIALVDDQGRAFGVTAGITTIQVRNTSLTAQATVVVSDYTPEPLTSLQIPGYANNVDAAGDFAYVAAGSAGLQVVDVSNHSAPFIAGSLDTPGNANDVQVIGNLVFIADGDAGLNIINVSNPVLPVSVGSVDTPGEAQDVVVSSGRAYVADGEAGLQVIDVSNPAAPTILGSLDTPNIARGVDVSGFYAVVVDDHAIRIVDVSNPAFPELTGDVLLSAEAKDVVVRGRLAYIAAFLGGFQIVDFSTPTSPTVVGILPLEAPGGFAPRDVELSRDFAFSAEQAFGNAVPVVSILNPASPTYSGALDFSPLADYAGTGIALDSQFVYMTGEQFIVTQENGVSGDTKLFIGQYVPENDTGDISPVVEITFPTEGQSVVVGDFMTVQAQATDDVGVARVEFRASGVVIGVDSTPPFQREYIVSSDTSPIEFEARAFDRAGNISEVDSITVTVIPDPLTTVNGRVLDLNQLPMAGVVVRLTDSIETTLTNEQGIFSFSGVESSPLGQLASATVLFPDGGGSISSAVPKVRGGITDLGDILQPSGGLEFSIPQTGTPLVAGEQLLVQVNPLNTINFVNVDFFVNGFQIGSGNPYQLFFTVPNNEGSTLEFQAFGQDENGVLRNAVPVTTQIVATDPGTTVIGRVVGLDGLPIANATITVSTSGQTTITDDQGRFQFENVGTVPLQTPIEVTITDSIGNQSGQVSALPFRGGITDLGDILHIPLGGLEFFIPQTGTPLVAGEQLWLQVNPLENLSFATVNFLANGSQIGNGNPYQLLFTVPNDGGNSIQFQAFGQDQNGILRNAIPITTQIVATDPLTTVIGRAVDSNETPIANAFVTIVGTTQTARTDDQGRFIIPDVGTIPLSTPIQISIADATGNQSGQVSALPVRGGTTDFGDIPLARTGS